MTFPPRPTHQPSNGHQPPNMTKTIPNSAGRTNKLIAGMGRGATANGNTHSSSGGKTGVAPGADFMSNEDIRAFCEHLRKDHRNRATERAMDADHLEAVLRTIPDSAGSRAGSRARARRVSRWLKKIAAAEKASQKYAAMLYGTFEREYEAQLRTIAPGRPRQNQRAPFAWR